MKLFLLRTNHKIFSVAVATVKIFEAVIGKKNNAWYGNNILDLTLGVSIHNKQTWREIYTFFNENMNILESLFVEYKDFIKDV